MVDNCYRSGHHLRRCTGIHCVHGPGCD
jgi:hypothetical protein